VRWASRTPGHAHELTETATWSSACGGASTSGGPSPPGYEKTGRLVAGVLCLAAALERGTLRLPTSRHEITDR
jgi:hypothetical protein